ncbi:hypothetical protein JOF53_002035 [Crossiella equi]|uniref:Uncharacterized protein n=1 Tax=Crossiella equi TaxID=130796 RepID=A0ABS5A9B2_9PSEU|nr:hypothetical protein [Crossiella equi]
MSQAAKAALDAGDAAIAEFLATGYLEAAKRDAEAKEAQLRRQEEERKAAEALTDLAKRAKRAAEARTHLIAAHAEGVRALQAAANAMTSAANASRNAEALLAENTAASRRGGFDDLKREVERQPGYAASTAEQARRAAAQAITQANILVETGLPRHAVGQSHRGHGRIRSGCEEGGGDRPACGDRGHRRRRRHRRGGQGGRARRESQAVAAQRRGAR